MWLFCRKVHLHFKMEKNVQNFNSNTLFLSQLACSKPQNIRLVRYILLKNEQVNAKEKIC